MRLLIAADMEGISGVVNWDQVNPARSEYNRFRKIMTQDINAAIRGAALGGAAEILVTDGHWHGTNILIEELDARATLQHGYIPLSSLLEDKGFDAAFFIGYHARAGSPAALLDHTWDNERVANVWLEDRLVGEIGLEAYLCGYYHIPVLLISGDSAACSEATGWIPGIETVQVKTAGSRFSATCLPLEEAQKRIAQASEQVLQTFIGGTGPAPCIAPESVTLTIEFAHTDMTENAALLPGVTRGEGRRISFSAATMREAYRIFQVLVAAARY